MGSFKNLQHFKEGLRKGKEMLILVQGEKSNFGLFYTKNSQQKENTLFPGKSSFFFSALNNSIKLFETSSRNPLAILNKIEDGEGEQLNFYVDEKSVVSLLFDGYGGSTINEGFIRGEPDSVGNVKTVEYWYLDTESADSYERVWTNEKVFAKRLLAQLSDSSFFRSEFKANANLLLLRQEPLFEFPSSLTVK